MSTPVSIRDYRPDDLDAVQRLAQKYASWDTTPTRVDIQGFYAISPQLFFVAETAGNVVGFVYGSESRHLPHETLMKWKANKVASIELLAVDENHRKQGIGTALVEKFLQACKAIGADLVTLSVPAEEVAARALYKRLEFKEGAYFLRKNL